MSSDDVAAQPTVAQPADAADGASGAAVADTAAPEAVAPVTDAKSSKSDEPNAAVANNDKADASKLGTKGGKLLPYNPSNSFFPPRPIQNRGPWRPSLLHVPLCPLGFA
jgi:hypothetical protein